MKNWILDFDIFVQKCLEMENLMQKQKAAIKQLEKEQTEVATEMKLAASSKNQKGSVKTT